MKFQEEKPGEDSVMTDVMETSADVSSFVLFFLNDSSGFDFCEGRFNLEKFLSDRFYKG